MGSGHRLEACATIAPKNFTPSIMVGASRGALMQKIQKLAAFNRNGGRI
jgi:hypothetical protein